MYALFASLLVASLAAGFLELSSSVAKRQRAAVDTKGALYLAEAGLVEAMAGLTVGKTGAVGTQAMPAAFGDGLFWVDSQDLPTGHVQLDATGMAGTASAQLSLVVEPGETSVASLGLFADGTVSVPPGSVVDSYDSSVGPYDAINAPEWSGRLGANGAVDVEGATTTEIHADVTVSEQGKLSVSDFATIHGQLQTGAMAQELPAVQLPGMDLESGIQHGRGLPLTIAPGRGGLEFLVLEPGAELLVTGPSLLEVGKLVIDAEARVVFDTSLGAIDLYVHDALRMEEGSLLETTGTDPTQLVVQVAASGDDPVVLGAKGDLYGIVFAPDAPVEVAGNLQVFGSLVAKELSFQGAARFHFDQHVLDSVRESSLPKVLSWRIVELAVESGAQPGMSPFQILGVDPLACPTPADAHEDVLLDIAYMDMSGQMQSWSGMESAFDWAKVSRTLRVTRSGSYVPDLSPVANGTPVAGAGALGAANPQGLIDAIAAAIDSSEIRDILVNHAPVPDSVMQAALDWPGITAGHLQLGFEANVPLTDGAHAMLLAPSVLNPSNVRNVLVAHPALGAQRLLDAVGASTLDSVHLASVCSSTFLRWTPRS